jgi:cytochrome c556
MCSTVCFRDSNRPVTGPAPLGIDWTRGIPEGMRRLSQSDTGGKMMRRLSVGLAAAAVAIAAAGAYALEDPIVTRQALMASNGTAAGAGAALMKGEIPFNVAVAKSVLTTMRAVSYSYGDYFPAGSDQGDTKASPKIWEDAAGFAAALEKFRTDVEAAIAADPQDLDSFKAAFGTVAGNCKACHDAFRVASN